MRHSRHHPRGLSRFEVVALLVVAAACIATALPIQNTIGGKRMRLQSMNNLVQQQTIHAMYAADWNQRQFTAVPDDLGAFGGDCAAWEAAHGKTIPGLVLGDDCDGTPIGFYGCENANARMPITLDFPNDNLNFASYYRTAGAYRFPNAAALTAYGNGRYYDRMFWAPDDPWMKRGASQYFGGDCGFEFSQDDPEPIGASSYILSPAAMWHPDVFGIEDPTTGESSFWNDPREFDESFASPYVTQCVYPELKTRIMEHVTVEVNLPKGMFPGFNPGIDGSNRRNPAPCLFNQSTKGRPLALFFDGSVRILSPIEVYDGDSYVKRLSGNSGASLSSRLGGGSNDGEYFRSYAVDQDSDNWSNHHVFTRYGIKGRDTLRSDDS